MSTTNPTPTPASPSPSLLEKILSDAEVAASTIASTASLFGPAGTGAAVGAALADKLLSLALTAIQAHRAISGVPIDDVIAQLHTIDPVPDPAAAVPVPAPNMPE